MEKIWIGVTEIFNFNILRSSSIWGHLHVGQFSILVRSPNLNSKLEEDLISGYWNSQLLIFWGRLQYCTQWILNIVHLKLKIVAVPSLDKLGLRNRGVGHKNNSGPLATVALVHVHHWTADGADQVSIAAVRDQGGKISNLQQSSMTGSTPTFPSLSLSINRWIPSFVFSP